MKLLTSAYAELFGELFIFDYTKSHFAMSNGYGSQLVDEIRIDLYRHSH